MRYCPPKYRSDGSISGSWCQAIREDAGISAKDFARVAGCCPQFVRNVEYGTKPIHARLADLYEAIARQQKQSAA